MSDADDPDLALASGAPPGLHVAEQPFSLAFHPANELRAVVVILTIFNQHFISYFCHSFKFLKILFGTKLFTFPSK